MNVRVEAVPANDELRVRTSAPVFVVPLRTAAIDLAIGSESFLVDVAHWALAPARRTLALRALNGSARVLIASIEGPLIAHVASTYGAVGLASPVIEQRLAEPRCLPRTTWVHELVHRYLFEREVCRAEASEAARFLECELVKEACFLAAESGRGHDRATRAQQEGELVARAVARIEENVLKPSSIAALARVCGASESTLLRAFRRELACTPGEFWRQRRLDEALALLESGRFGVAEVAIQVGYQSATAFSEAFVRQFGRAPSTVGPGARRRANRRAR